MSYKGRQAIGDRFIIVSKIEFYLYVGVRIHSLVLHANENTLKRNVCNGAICKMLPIAINLYRVINLAAVTPSMFIISVLPKRVTYFHVVSAFNLQISQAPCGRKECDGVVEK